MTRKLPSKAKNALAPANQVTPLSPAELSDAAREAAEEILTAGRAENTDRSYRSAMRYWSAWYFARYRQRLSLPISVAVAVQFVVDHAVRQRRGETVIELPADIDAQLVEAGFKAERGPLKLSTVLHRVSVLSKFHQLQQVENPCADVRVTELLAQARRAAAKRGERPNKKTAATREPLEAMLATCDDSLQGVRDRALLLFTWASGGRRRSESAMATVEQLTCLEDGNYAFRLGYSKTNQDGDENQSLEKPINGPAATALGVWLARSGIQSGAIFRRLWNDRVGPALSPKSVAEIVKKHASMAGISGNWGGHSLRAGFVTEAGQQNVPLGDVMAMTDHRQAATVMGYYRTGQLKTSKAANLLRTEGAQSLPSDSKST